ncbi:MAG: beta-galactosidase [Pseudomonadota bacterium]
MSPRLGVCYYPEHWPETQWADDAQRMADVGLSIVRIGEFAWSRLEPQPGTFDWDWLDRAMHALHSAGLGVVLGTPTATPPRWMLTRHPDMLAVDVDGRPRGFGSRRHYCFSHLGYRAEAVRIAELMAKRYAAHPALIGWQTDNEYGCHATTLSYSQAALAGFRLWLAERYGDIATLNAVWGNVFWSMEYDSFDEINLPNLTVTEAAPAHWLDFYRYTSEQVVAFNKAQCDVLRAHSAAPLIHNYMGKETDFDHFDVGADLDIASWDSYPLGFLEDRINVSDESKLRFARSGDPDFQAFHHDLYRAVGRGRWWVMEQQPGPVNWAQYNPAPLPGMVRLWGAEALAHGAEAVCYFRWRQAPFAQEQMHAGLLRPDSVDAPGLSEVASLSAELAQFEGDQSSPVALVFDYESVWAAKIEAQGQDFDLFDLVLDHYRALRRLGLSVDIISPKTADLSLWKMVVIPGLMIWRTELRDALEKYEGVVVAGPSLGRKTNNFSIPNPLPPNLPGLDLRVSRVETLRPGLSVGLEDGGSVMRWREEVEGAAPVLEDYSDGSPALLGSEDKLYITGWGDLDALRRWMERAAKTAGLTTYSLPDRLRIRDFGTKRFVMNYGPDPVALSRHLPSVEGTLAAADYIVTERPAD